MAYNFSGAANQPAPPLSVRTPQQVLDAVRGALALGINPSLETITQVVSEMGNPQRDYRVLQVTGTNGKTSSSRAAEALLRAHGARTGLYTSPDLIEYRERICVDGSPVSWDEFGEAVGHVIDVNRAMGEAEGYTDGRAHITEFELLTAGALYAYQRHGVEWAVLEAGLGGRWDATSVADAEVAVITGVSLDHTHILGDTRELIADDKSAIIKPSTRLAVMGPATEGVEHIIMARAAKTGTTVVAVEWADGESPLPEEQTARVTVHATEPSLTRAHHGAISTMFSVKTPRGEYPHLRVGGPAYQAINVGIAITAVEGALGRTLDLGAVHDALCTLTFPARLEVIDPRFGDGDLTLSGGPAGPLIFDGGHNPEAAGYLAAAIQELLDAPGGLTEKPIVAIGVFGDKDLAGIVGPLLDVAGGYIAVQAPTDRGMRASTLAERLESITGIAPVAVLESPTLDQIRRAGMGRGVVLTGSLSLYHLLESNEN